MKIGVLLRSLIVLVGVVLLFVVATASKRTSPEELPERYVIDQTLKGDRLQFAPVEKIPVLPTSRPRPKVKEKPEMPWNHWRVV